MQFSGHTAWRACVVMLICCVIGLQAVVVVYLANFVSNKPNPTTVVPPAASQPPPVSVNTLRQQLIQHTDSLLPPGQYAFPGQVWSDEFRKQLINVSDQQFQQTVALGTQANMTLVSCLGELNPFTRQYALIMLVRINGKDATRMLVSMLSDPHPLVRGQTVYELSELYPTSRFGQLLQERHSFELSKTYHAYTIGEQDPLSLQIEFTVWLKQHHPLAYDQTLPDIRNQYYANPDALIPATPPQPSHPTP